VSHQFITDPEKMVFHGELMVEEGCITINWSNVVDMRPAEDDEIEHAQIHGW
jgi:hypothetical protein